MLWPLACCGVLLLQGVPTHTGADDSIQPVPYSQVTIVDAFWAPKIEINRTVSIQHVFNRSEEHGGGGPAQLIEAAAYMLHARGDAALERRVDALIDRVAAGLASRSGSPESTIRTN